MSEKSIYQKYEDVTRHYYGADKDILRIVPTAKDKEVAHQLALGVESHIATITDEDITTSALRAQTRERFSKSRDDQRDLDTLKEEYIQDRLNMAVVNTELTHAKLAPGDFNEDSEESFAYQMGIGYVLPDLNDK